MSRKPLSFYEIQPGSGLVIGGSRKAAGHRSSKFEFDVRNGNQPVAALVRIKAMSLVSW